MCGRFVLMSNLADIEREFSLQQVACDYRPSNNILPGQDVFAVIHDGITRLTSFRWGLIPPWAKDPSIGRRLINARAETLQEKPSFKNAFKKRRCLIIADGFYESLKEGKRKTPFLFRLKSGKPFGFAGLYETWTSPQRECVRTCTIITTEPNELIKPIHSRMPVIIPKQYESLWIHPSAENVPLLTSLLQPYPAGEMEALRSTS